MEKSIGGVKYAQCGGEVAFCPNDDFELEKIFECGQCFRWDMGSDGSYTGVALGKAARIRREGDGFLITGTERDFTDVWFDYFDLGKNYSEARNAICIDDYMKAASDYGAGIRILAQDRWEGLCSFIISQCNNIPRIKKIISALCSLAGEPTELLGKTYMTFPSAERVAGLTVKDLEPLRCGYRAPYILGAAEAVASGKLDLEKTAMLDSVSALKELKSLNGVGDKVANCVILFALRMPEAFPVDTWIKKALSERYGKDFDPKVFSKNAGLAQQYMFYYRRSGNV